MKINVELTESQAVTVDNALMHMKLDCEMTEARVCQNQKDIFRQMRDTLLEIKAVFDAARKSAREYAHRESMREYSETL